MSPRTPPTGGSTLWGSPFDQWLDSPETCPARSETAQNIADKRERNKPREEHGRPQAPPRWRIFGVEYYFREKLEHKDKHRKHRLDEIVGSVID
ncbi:hypothetical protein ABW20_dc0104100 [Dactylellina cionopaga]|nr:hypothetical protein ABW20_dc0104100 [Dactylellina cionopaga]